jgi:hypothetical protein
MVFWAGLWHYVMSQMSNSVSTLEYRGGSFLWNIDTRLHSIIPQAHIFSHDIFNFYYSLISTVILKLQFLLPWAVFLWCIFMKLMNVCNPLSFLSNTQAGMTMYQHPKCGIRLRFWTYRHIFPIILQILVALCWSTGSNCSKEINFYACLQNCEKWLLVLLCLSVHSEQLGSHWMDYYVIWYLWVFQKSVRTIWVLKFVKNKGCFTLRLKFVYGVSLYSSQNEKCFRQILCSINPPHQKNSAVYEIM